MMVERSKVLEQKQSVSTKISDLARYICFALLAVFYTLVTSGSELAINMIAARSNLLAIMAISAAVAILFDYLQFLFGYFNCERALSNKNDPTEYPRDVFWVGRYFFFYTKQALTLLGVGVLIFVMVTSAI